MSSCARGAAKSLPASPILNHRLAVTDSLCARGFDVNLMIWELPLVSVAAMNGWNEIVALLVRAGADLDIRGWRPNQSAREIIAERGGGGG